MRSKGVITRMDEWLRFFKKVFIRTILLPLRMLPVKSNRLLLINDLARKYSGNPKYIAEYLCEKYPGKFEIIFTLSAPGTYKDQIPPEVRPVRINSAKYFYFAMTAKVLITNSGGFSYLPLRKSQHVLNTWHGGGAYKKCGTDMYNCSNLFKRDLRLSANKTTAFLSTNQRFTKVISKSMLIPENVFWEIGMPRNDFLIQNNQESRSCIRHKLGLSDGEKLVLFAPTYRKPHDNYFKESIAISYGIDVARVCAALKKRFGGDWKCAFRLHPRVVNRQEYIPEGTLDLSDYEDMQELLLAADVLINDFSSSFWDFMLTGKPGFLFATDLQHYIETTEVYTPVSEWPFPKSTNNDELEHNILSFDEKKYRKDCKSHYEALGGCETGKAAQLVCEWVYNKCFPKNADV